jgi:hypothetical protein
LPLIRKHEIIVIAVTQPIFDVTLGKGLLAK